MMDDLYTDGRCEPLTEDDDFLQHIVRGSELPVLLAAIACATGDLSYIPEELRPPLPPVDTAPHPHGGMDAPAQEKARSLALRGLRAMRDGPRPAAPEFSEADIDALLDYLSNGRIEWRQMLRHELRLAPSGGGRPDWSVADYEGGRDFSVLIIGAGIAGIAAAHRFTQAGFDMTIVEAGPDVGGTWRKNVYPGVRLDTPTFGYSYSFAQQAEWPHQFATGGEVLDYLRDVSARAGITDRAEFSTRVKKLVWNEGSSTWTATTVGPEGQVREREFNAVVSGLGQLDSPNIPDFPGLADFSGTVMHSQEWLPDVDCAGRRVAVIGTGASAYQIVPAVYQQAESLVVFQRSAPWMLPADNYHDEIPATFDWLRNRVRHYAELFRLWTFIQGVPGRFHTVRAEEGWEGAPLSVSAKNQEVRDTLVARLESQFAGHPELLRTAIPTYPPGAKRMLRDNGVWAAALTDVDTSVVTAGVDTFVEDGIIDGEGVRHELDVVILATGFTPSDYLEGVEIIGVDGVEIHDFWGGDSRAYNGATVPGFPNFFMLYGPNIGGVVAGSLHFMIERSVEFSLKALREVLARGAQAIDVKREALDRFVSWVDRENEVMAWGQDYVSTWYQNRFGRVSQVWPYTNLEYWQITESVNEDDHVFLGEAGEGLSRHRAEVYKKSHTRV